VADDGVEGRFGEAEVVGIGNVKANVGDVPLRGLGPRELDLRDLDVDADDLARSHDLCQAQRDAAGAATAIQHSHAGA
jgi:hypothetical protein